MHKTALAALVCAALPLSGCNRQPAASGSAPAVELKTEEQKTLYALGLIVGRNVTPFNLTPAELAIVQAGMRDQILGRQPQVELEVFGPRVNQLAMQRSRQRAEREKAGAKDFLDRAAREEGARRLQSGLIIKTLRPGTGPSPTAEDRVRVHYHGTLTNGAVFDSSVQRGEPAEFPLRGVIPCWTEGVQQMKVGEKARLVCPSQLAYGDEGRPPMVPGGATLIFEVELLDIVRGATATPQGAKEPAAGTKEPAAAAKKPAAK
ncbi:MAG: FKBP-type peptidyl-prolyl cis-trans isomerase [Myxococcales bacterium]|nr:FKBP-type peptidyl-prolyl cis-trans isomerase [Myxococcota bacterium]MDW8281578.1 FKBP-type peptidyl-prolyl cis-trans isomerase [Myxococcales bacterium]